MKLTDSGICPCGGKLKSTEWETETQRKGRTTCTACGRTELRTEDLEAKPAQGEISC